MYILPGQKDPHSDNAILKKLRKDGKLKSAQKTIPSRVRGMPIRLRDGIVCEDEIFQFVPYCTSSWMQILVGRVVRLPTLFRCIV